MEWVKLAAIPPFYTDAALQRAGESAEILYCRALAFAGMTESKGVVAKASVMLLVTDWEPRMEVLVREGLWLDQGDSYLIRSWDKWQDRHDAAADVKRKARDKKRAQRQSVRNVLVPTVNVPGLSRDCPPDVPLLDRDREKEQTLAPPSASPAVTQLRPAAVPASFDIWWQAYPAKKAKGAAIKAYKAALKIAPADVLLDAALAYSKDPLRKANYTPYPATWLNGQQWLNEPTQQATIRYSPSGHVREWQ